MTFNTSADYLGSLSLTLPLGMKLFGCSAAAQVKTSRETKGAFLSVNMAFSVGVMSAMYLTKGITGKKNGHSMNFGLIIIVPANILKLL